MNFVLFLVDSLETICFHLKKKKGLVCNDVFDLLEENAIFICIIVIFENLVELRTLV